MVARRFSTIAALLVVRAEAFLGGNQEPSSTNSAKARIKKKVEVPLVSTDQFKSLPRYSP
jgi:hypothetical protein